MKNRQMTANEATNARRKLNMVVEEWWTTLPQTGSERLAREAVVRWAGFDAG